MTSIHTPVLLHEVIEGLHPVAGMTYLDGTLGGGGHARMIADACAGDLTVIGLDQDPAALSRAGETLKGKAKDVIFEHENFRRLGRVLDAHGIRTVDRILLDLGISSDELEHSGRGFSFMKDEPLQMTLGEPAQYPFVAADIVNSWKEEDIANVIFAYGEEHYARRIAKALTIYRDKKQIQTSGELGEIVKMSVPPIYRRGKIHPATRTFQALRIAVNDELAALREGLRTGYERLAPKGRMAVISFHSLEDRIVKDFYKEQAKKKEGKQEAVLITKKPIRPSAQEIAENPRSRSAKLRIIEKI